MFERKDVVRQCNHILTGDSPSLFSTCSSSLLAVALVCRDVQKLLLQNDDTEVASFIVEKDLPLQVTGDNENPSNQLKYHKGL